MCLITTAMVLTSCLVIVVGAVILSFIEKEIIKNDQS